MNSSDFVMPDADGATSDSSLPPPLRDDEPSGRVLGGVAALIADRLGLNPFWLRMAFVVLALAGGLGVIVYAGLWLILVAGAEDRNRPARFVGGAVMVIGVLWLLDRGDTGFSSGTTAVVALLVGLALALWQPRTAGAMRPRLRPTDLAAAQPRPVRRRPPRKPPSLLGRAVLGLAVVTAAVGALIDQANGGRMHPEQWLGAAAAVCGAGMLLGVFWGSARWLILPAVGFAATGYVGGVAADFGVPIRETGDAYLDIGPYGPSGGVERSFGDVFVSVFGDPPMTDVQPGVPPDPRPPIDPGMRPVRVLFGDVDFRYGVESDLSIDLRWNVEHGSATIDGIGRPDSGSFRLGPDGPADVTIDVEIWRGDFTVWNQQSYEVPDGEIPLEAPLDTVTTVVPGSPSLAPTYVAENVSATSDGYFLLANGEAMIDDQDQVVLGEWYEREVGVIEINTSYGPFQLLPRGILLTPYDEVIDLQAWRARLAPAAAPDSGVTTTIAPGTTLDQTGTSTTDVAPQTTVGQTGQGQSSTTSTAPGSTAPTSTVLAGG